MKPTKGELGLFKEVKESLGWMHIEKKTGNVYLRNEFFEMGMGPLHELVGVVRPRLLEVYAKSISPEVKILDEQGQNVNENISDLVRYSPGCRPCGH